MLRSLSVRRKLASRARNREYNHLHELELPQLHTHETTHFVLSGDFSQPTGRFRPGCGHAGHSRANALTDLVVLVPLSAREHRRRSSALGKRRYLTNLPYVERSRPVWHQKRVENAANACPYRPLHAVSTTSQLPQQRRLRLSLSTTFPDLVQRCSTLPSSSLRSSPRNPPLIDVLSVFIDKTTTTSGQCPLFIPSRTPLHCRKTPTMLIPFTLSSAISLTLPKSSVPRTRVLLSF